MLGGFKGISRIFSSDCYVREDRLLLGKDKRVVRREIEFGFFISGNDGWKRGLIRKIE